MIRERLSLGAEEYLTCDIVSGLTELDANSLEITSVVVIQNLTSLDSLYLGVNSIRGISPLSRLTNLTDLRLANKPNLTDIQPLLDNPGLGTGDTVHLESTGVNCTDVAALEAKGVAVQSDCP